MSCQKAPGAKRCIKTAPGEGSHVPQFGVRKYRAPKGALRPRITHSGRSIRSTRQKAPSAKRCIKTWYGTTPPQGHPCVRKHRAPKGALRRDEPRRAVLHEVAGQKAPSAKRCIKTRVTPVSGVEAAAGSESTERQKVH